MTTPWLKTDYTHDDAVNMFSYAYFEKIITSAKYAGYKTYTVGAFIAAGCPNKNALVIRHDLDFKPASLRPLLELEHKLGVRSSVYVRVTANDYNPFSYENICTFRDAEAAGFELGLHSNFEEYGLINTIDPWEVLKFETDALRSFIKNKSLACHRDLNYTYNSLPWTVKNWDRISHELGYEFQAYDQRVLDSTIYTNEGYMQHLGWRNKRPEDVIPTGDSIYLLIHPHWWWKNNPFENGW